MRSSLLQTVPTWLTAGAGNFSLPGRGELAANEGFTGATAVGADRKRVAKWARAGVVTYLRAKTATSRP